MPSGVGWERVLHVYVGDGARVGIPYVVYTLEFPCLRLRGTIVLSGGECNVVRTNIIPQAYGIFLTYHNLTLSQHHDVADKCGTWAELKYSSYKFRLQISVSQSALS